MSRSLPQAASSTTGRISPDVLTYTYGPRMVYVAPGKNYDEAIDIAKETFPELRDVERDRICLEVYVALPDQQKQTAQISRSAWSFIVPSLARFEIVKIRVAPPTPTAASSSFKTTVVDPSHASETSWRSASDHLPPLDDLASAPCPAYSPSPLLCHSSRPPVPTPRTLNNDDLNRRNTGRHLSLRWYLPVLWLRSSSRLLTRVGIWIKGGR